jgi:hypothetical protein
MNERVREREREDIKKNEKEKENTGREIGKKRREIEDREGKEEKRGQKAVSLCSERVRKGDSREREKEIVEKEKRR